LETFFVAEEKHAISVQNFREKPIFQDLFDRPPDISGMSGKASALGRVTPSGAGVSRCCENVGVHFAGVSRNRSST
jgi:hypothetical protein